MILRRADILYMADIRPTSFNSLASRGQLPFKTHAEPGRGWSTYRPDVALRLVLLGELTKMGQPQARAAQLIREHFDALVEYAEGSEAKRPRPFLFGMANPSGVKAGDEDDFVAISTRVGRVDHDVEASLRAEGWNPGDLGQLCLVNVTDALRVVLSRAGGGQVSLFNDLVQTFQACK